MEAGGSGQAVSGLERAAGWVGNGVRLLQEVRLAEGVEIRYEASNGNGSEEARGHGQKVQDLILERFEDQQGVFARAITGADCNKFIRISATEVQLGEPAERLVGGVVVRLQGNKAVIPLAAIDMDFDGRGHMTYLFQKVTADFLSRHGVSVIAVEADHDFWRREAFGLEQLIDKRGNIDYDLVFSRQYAVELTSMRTIANVPLLVGTLTAAVDVPLPLTAAEANARAEPRRSSNAAAATAGRVGGKDCSPSCGKVEVQPPQDLVDWFGTDRATLTLYDTASAAAGQAGRDFLFLVAARARGIPAPQLLCPDSSLELAEEEGLNGVASIDSWEELKRKLKGWRKSGVLRRYLQRVAGSLQQEGEQEGEGAEQHSAKKRSRHHTQRTAASSGRPPRAKKQRRTTGAGATQQAQQGGRVGAAQPATPTPRDGPAAPAAEAPLVDQLLDAVAAEKAAGLTQQLVGAYFGCLPAEILREKEAVLLGMLRRSMFDGIVELMTNSMPK